MTDEAIQEVLEKRDVDEESVKIHFENMRKYGVPIDEIKQSALRKFE